MDNFLLSFLIMMLWSLIFIGMFLGMRKTKILRSKIGISGSILICTILLVRMAIPFDIGIARRVEVYWPWFLKWYKAVKITKFSTIFGDASVIQIAGVIWGVIAIIRLIQFARLYIRQRNVCHRSILYGSEEYTAVLRKVCEKRNYKHKILLTRSSEITSPICIGIRNPYIVLPERSFSATELEYIFSHEITHLKNHDLCYLMAANLLTCIFWWNPLTYVVRTELEYALEVRCDIAATAGYTKEESLEYLGVILKILAEGRKDNRLLTGNGVGFAKDSFDKVMEERFHAVLDQEPMKGSSKAGFHVWCIGMAGLLVCSYMFIVAPYYDADMGAGQELNSSEMWTTTNEKGEYVLHFWKDGELVEQVVEEDMISTMETEMGVREE